MVKEERLCSKQFLEENNRLPVTMYKNNSRDSSNSKDCSPIQLSFNLIGMKTTVGFYSFTNRCASLIRYKRWKI
jgi:hypothetical protein